ncbi:MAG: twin-arginine translocase TatA/TatE family subunit [Acidimicrobiia bacterium]|nr:twin-arginine translocase TatA/TatE family subunit [Acidimicrobiia bacterium]
MPAGLTSPVHLFVIIAVALIVLGPEKLPHALRQVGRTMGEVRRWTDSISGELRGALSLDDGAADAPPTPPTVAAAATLTPPVLAAVATNGNGATGSLASSAPMPVVAPAGATDGPGVLSTQPALQEGGEWH